MDSSKVIDILLEVRKVCNDRRWNRFDHGRADRAYQGDVLTVDCVDGFGHGLGFRG